MPSGVCEKAFMPTTCELVATPRIDGTTLDTRTNHLDSGLLDLANRLVHRNEVGGALSHQKRSRHVRVIALHECTNVDDEGVPVHDSTVGRTMMWERRIRTARHDRVVTRSIGARLAHQILEFVPDVALRHFANFQQGIEAGKCRVCTGRSKRDSFELGIVLAFTNDADESIHAMHSRRHSTKRIDLSEGELRRVERDARVTSNIASNDLIHLTCGPHDMHLEITIRTTQLLGRLLAVPTVDAQDSTGTSHDSEPGRSGESSEISDVGERADEDRVVFQLDEPISNHAESTVDDDRRETRHD